jgi:hypothetical protein
MSQTQRTTTDVYNLLADNTSGGISPQDLRDGFATWRLGHGQIYVAAADATAISIAATSNYYEATAVPWTLTSGAHLFDESAGNGRLTYTGVADVWCHVACSISVVPASPVQTLHFRIGLSGTTDAASEVIRYCANSTDIGSTALHLITGMSTGQYLSLWARNETSSANVTLHTANLQVVTMPT